MNRTPRSASRRASRQLAANVPGLRDSGPYSSKMRSGSFETSVSSGTERLHPVRHLVLRDARGDLRIAELLELQLVQLARSSSMPPPRPLLEARRVRQIQHRIADRAELHALVLATAGSRCPTAGRRAADRSGCPVPCEIITTNAGRSLVLAAQAVGQPRRRCSAGRPAARRSGRT